MISAEVVDESLDGAVDLGLLSPQLSDLLDRVHDGRVVLVVELFPDIRVGEICQLFTEIHRDLSGKGDVLRVVAALDLAHL